MYDLIPVCMPFPVYLYIWLTIYVPVFVCDSCQSASMSVYVLTVYTHIFVCLCMSLFVCMYECVCVYLHMCITF